MCACAYANTQSLESHGLRPQTNLYELEIFINGPFFFVLYFPSLRIIALTTQLEIWVRNVGQILDFSICPLLSTCVSPASSSNKHQTGLSVQDMKGNTHEKMWKGLTGWKSCETYMQLWMQMKERKREDGKDGTEGRREEGRELISLSGSFLDCSTVLSKLWQDRQGIFEPIKGVPRLPGINWLTTPEALSLVLVVTHRACGMSEMQ